MTQGAVPMTATSSGGTPLIIAVLALGISSLSAIGSIAAVLVARANMQRQIQATAREAWMREFRERVATLLANEHLLHALRRQTYGIAEAERHLSELEAMRVTAHQVIILLIAELAQRGLPHSEFTEALGRFLSAPGEKEAADELTIAAAVILMGERAAIEAPGRWRAWQRSGLGL